MKKKTLIIIGVLVMIGMIFLLRPKSEDLNIYQGVATVISAPSFKKVVVSIENNEKGKKKEAEIYSNIFWENDKVEVEYLNMKKATVIKKIEAIYDTESNKRKIISQISSDVSIRRYREQLEAIVTDANNEEAIKLEPFLALPEKLEGQRYELNLTPKEFLEIRYKHLDFTYGVNKDAIIEVTSDVNFEILSLDYIDKEEKKNSLTYESDKNGFTIKAIGDGVIYSAILKFDNGDIINYIFA